MLFYRVERDGKGPYTSYQYGVDIDLERMSADHAFCSTHPTPYEDEGIRGFHTGYHVCGFTGFEKMVKWFDGWGDALAESGFRVRVYDTREDHVVTGEFQDIAPANALKSPVDEFSPAGM
jgi:ribosome modulation factor